MITRTVGRILRGKATPFQLFTACVLGAMLGFLPGADDEINRELQAQNDAWLGRKGGLLYVVSAADGRKLAEYKLNSFPVFDGMSAAEGGLYLSQIDGSLVKFRATAERK